MPPSELNERGFFESLPIYELHEEMLESFGTSWDDLSPMPEGWERSGLASQYIDRMADVVRDEYGGSPLFAIKDPRICRLVPFWKEVLARLDVQVRFVLPLRNPLEVGASLSRAQGISEQRGRLLWLSHFLLAEKDSRGTERCILTYAQLMDDWRAVLERISRSLDIVLPRMSHRSAAEIDGFLTDSLRHHAASVEKIDVRDDVVDWTRSAYRWGERAARGEAPPASEMDSVFDAFFEGVEAFGPVVATSEHQRREAAEEVARLRDDLDRARSDLAMRRPVGGEVPQDMEERVGEISDAVKGMALFWRSQIGFDPGSGQTLSFDLSDERARIEPDGTRSDLESLDSVRQPVLEVLAERITDRTDQVQSLESQLEIARERVATLERTLSEKDTKLATHVDSLIALEREAAGLRAEVSGIEPIRARLSKSREREEASARRIAELEREVGDARERARGLEASREQIATLTQAQESQSKALEVIEARMRHRDEELAERELEIQRLRAAEVEQAASREEAEAQAEAAGVRYAELEAEYQELVATRAAESVRLGELEETIQARDMEIRGQRAELLKIPRLRARLVESEVAVVRIREESESELERRSSEMRGALETSAIEIARLGEQAGKLPAALDEIETMQRESVRSQLRIESLERDLEQSREEVRLAESKAARVAQELEEKLAAEESRQREAAARAQAEADAKPDPRWPTGLVTAVSVGLPPLAKRSSGLALPKRLAKLVWWTVSFQLAKRLRERRIVRRIRESGVFDENYYRAQSPDLRGEFDDPIYHYVRHGASEGRNPNAAFDTRFYLESYPDVGSLGANPLDHFLSHGAHEGRRPHPFFDPRYYVATNPDVAASAESPLHHWLHSGAAEGRRPVPRTTAGVGERISGAGPHPTLLTEGDPHAVESALPTRTAPLLEGAVARSGEVQHPVEVLRAPIPGVTSQRLELGPHTALDRTRIELARARQFSTDPRDRAAPDDPVVLVVTHEIPYPPRAGNQYRIFRYVKWLKERGNQVITIFCPLPGEEISAKAMQAAAKVLGNLIVCARSGAVVASLAPHLEFLLEGMDGSEVADFEEAYEPFERFPGEHEDEFVERVGLERTFCPDVLAHVVLRIDARLQTPSALIANYVWMSRLLPRLREHTLRIIDTHDMFSAKQKKVDAFGVPNQLRLSEFQESALLGRGDIVMAIQPEEAREFERIAPSSNVLTIGVDFDPIDEEACRIPPAELPPTLAVIGSGNAMNVKGLHEFLRHAWPLIRRDRPDARLMVAGAVGDSVPQDTPGVEILGRVESPSTLYQSCHLVINPTSAGTGLKIKTLEAIAHHRRIVTWPLGVEGVPQELLQFCGIVEDWYAFYIEVLRALDESHASVDRDSKKSELIREQLSATNVYRLLGEAIDLHCRPGVRGDEATS